MNKRSYWYLKGNKPDRPKDGTWFKTHIKELKKKLDAQEAGVFLSGRKYYELCSTPISQKDIDDYKRLLGGDWEKPQEYYISDPETGTPFRVTKQHYDAYWQMIKNLKTLSYADGKNKLGTIMIVGTTAENTINDFKKIWNEQGTTKILPD